MTAQAFKEAITVHVKSFGPQASAAMAQTAHAIENRIVGQQASRRGIKPGVEEAVDGRRGVPFEAVKPDGIIYMGFDYRAEIVSVCFEELRARSPVESGTYRSSHFAMLDGKGLEPLQIPATAQLFSVSRITITNPVPYARKLEVGLTESGKPFVKQVDPHIFESAMMAVRREYSSVAKFSFGFVDLESAYTIRTSRGSGRQRHGRGPGSKVRYPAIFIDRA